VLELRTKKGKANIAVGLILYGSPTWTRTRDLRINSPTPVSHNSGLCGVISGPQNVDSSHYITFNNQESLFFCGPKIATDYFQLTRRVRFK